MKKIICMLLAAVMTAAVPVCSFADDKDAMSFAFRLTADGAESAEVSPGNEIDVAAQLERTDSRESFPMYAMQYDIWYDSDIFELIADSVSAGSGDIRVNVRSLDGSRDGWSCVSASAYSSSAGGDEWDAVKDIVSFKLKAVKVGSASIQSKNGSVSRSDGMSGYDISANDASVTVKTKSQQNGGSGGSSNGSGGSSGGSASGGDSQTPAGGGASNGGAQQGGGTATQPDNGSGNVQDKPESSASESFTDVPAGAWYESAVSYALKNGLFSGTSDRTFSPDGTMTRAMLVTVLWRMDGSPASSSGSTFSDVKNGSWYSGAVAWAAEKGIVTGYGNGTFGVNDSVTRQQLAAVLYRYTEAKGGDVSASADMSAYADFADTASWAVAPMSWAVGKGMINGVKGNTLAPSGTATRAQCAAILMRYAEM